MTGQSADGSARQNILTVAERLLWYALTTPPQKEFVAQTILERQGLRTFIPVRREWRRRNKYTKKKELRAFPIGSRYVFVGFEPGRNLWFDLFQLSRPGSARIITGVIGMGMEPRQLRTDHVVDLMRRLGGGLNAPDVQRYMLSNKEFHIGELVEIVDGPFSGMVVPVTEVRGTQAKVLLELFGGNQETLLPTDILQAAA